MIAAAAFLTGSGLHLPVGANYITEGGLMRLVKHVLCAQKGL